MKYLDYEMYKRYVMKNECILYEDSINYTYRVNSPHDKLFRELLNDKTEFCLFLKQFLGKNKITKNSITKCNKSFISCEYKNKEADIVYKLKNKPIYFLIEHQSTVDESMPYRILNYYEEILRDSIDYTKIKIKKYKMPIVVPIVLYTGEMRWNVKTNFKDKQYESKEYEESKIDIEYNLIDANDFCEEELLAKDSAIAYALLIEKNKGKEELINVLNKISKVCIDNKRTNNIKRIIRYILSPILGKKDTNEMIKKFKYKEADVIMKTAQDYIREEFEAWKKKCKIEGTEEGRREGRKEGIKENSKNVARIMLKNGETSEKIKLYTGINKKEIENIRKEMKLTN